MSLAAKVLQPMVWVTPEAPTLEPGRMGQLPPPRDYPDVVQVLFAIA